MIFKSFADDQGFWTGDPSGAEEMGIMYSVDGKLIPEADLMSTRDWLLHMRLLRSVSSK